VAAIFRSGLAAGIGGLVAVEDDCFSSPSLPTKVTIVRVASQAPGEPRYVGALEDGSETDFGCEYGGSIGDTKTISTKRGLLTGRLMVKSECWLQIAIE
jgi:hypothetical protein